MSEASLTLLALAGAALGAIAMITTAALRGWRGWLELKRVELTQARDAAAPPSPGQRIEIADLKERIRKLEAIAAGIEL